MLFLEARGGLILSIKASKRWRRVPRGEMELKRINALRKELGLDKDLRAETEAKELVNV